MGPFCYGVYGGVVHIYPTYDQSQLRHKNYTSSRHAIMGYVEFNYTHLYPRMVSVIQIFVAFSILVDFIHSESISDDVICELIINTIHVHNLAQLLGRHQHSGYKTEDVAHKRSFTYARGLQCLSQSQTEITTKLTMIS